MFRLVATTWLVCACPGRSYAQGAGGGTTPAAARVVEIAAGFTHTCARMSDATVRCWGANDRGQLGAPAHGSCVNGITMSGVGPTSTPCRDAPAPVGIAGVAQIAAAAETTCARLGDGTVRCWGANTDGTVGDGTTTDRAIPTAVVGLSNATQIALSDTHACARLADGGVACWGNNFHGELGTVSAAPPSGAVARTGFSSVYEPTPRRVPGLSGVVDVAVGERFTCARLSTGDVSCFGQQVQTQRASAVPSVVAALRGARAVVLGRGNHCGLFADGTVRCWGHNQGGLLLDGSRAARLTPAPAAGLVAPSNVAMIGQRACAVVARGEVQCWGDMGSGVIAGLQRLALPIPATQVALGAYHACAVGSDGSAWCWGDTFYGAAGPRGATVGAPVDRFWTPPRRVVP
jgi:alpha-tubulin suppressor-like RCC1 family protein